VSLSAELFEHFEHAIESLTLIPSDGGRFEVSLNEQLIYSKLQTKRHAEAGEIVNLISKIVEG
jgi:selenoprotein W-related protein